MEDEIKRYSEHLEELVNERTRNLKESESRYKSLIENIPQKIFTKDRNSAYVSCNDNFAEDLKIKAEDIVGKTDYDFFPKDLADHYQADDKRILESGRTEEIEEEYVVGGQKHWINTTKTPMRRRRRKHNWLDWNISRHYRTQTDDTETARKRGAIPQLIRKQSSITLGGRFLRG